MTNSYIQHDGNYIAYGKKTIPHDDVSGSGDFSIVEVSINNNTNSDISCAIPVISDLDEIEAMIGIPANDNTTYPVVLYHNKCGIFIDDDGVQISVSGDITAIDEYYYNITGNGIIVIE